MRKRKEPIPNESEFQGNGMKKLIDKIRDHSFSHSFIHLCSIFQKANICYPLTRTRMCAYQGVRNVSFSENFAHVLNE